MIFYSFQEQKDVPDSKEWLHPSELEMLREFRFEKRKKDWLLGRWTAKRLLVNSLLENRAMHEIAVLPGRNRAPFVYLDQKEIQIQISISHSNSQAFCICGEPGFQMGCDLEKVEKRSDNFIKDYFSQGEKDQFLQHSGILDEDSFYNLCWSAKEALMKASRKGMSLHPKKIEVNEVQILNKTWNSMLIQEMEKSKTFFAHWTFRDDMVAVIASDIKEKLVEVK